MTKSEMKKLRELAKTWASAYLLRLGSGKDCSARCASDLSLCLDTIALSDSPDSTHQHVVYNQGWHDACLAVTDAITVLTLGPKQSPVPTAVLGIHTLLSKMAAEVLADHVTRAHAVVIEVYRRKA